MLLLLPPRAPPPWLPGPGLWPVAASGGRRKRAAAAADAPWSPLLCAGLGEGIRHIGAGAEGALQPRVEAGRGGGPGLDRGGVGRAGARESGE